MDSSPFAGHECYERSIGGDRVRHPALEEVAVGLSISGSEDLVQRMVHEPAAPRESAAPMSLWLLVFPPGLIIVLLL